MCNVNSANRLVITDEITNLKYNVALFNCVLNSFFPVKYLRCYLQINELDKCCFIEYSFKITKFV